MRTFIHRGRPALLALLGLAMPVAAAEKPAPTPLKPDRTELWVPSEDLEKVLEKNKNAVLLTPEQYESLIRDAGKVKPELETAPPPVSAIVEEIRLSGKVVDGESAILIRGQIRARALATGWSHASVVLPWSSIGRLNTRGDALLENPHALPTKAGSASESDALMLWMKGPAEHQIEFECAARILQGSSPDERVLVFRSGKVPAVLDLDLPTGSQITQGPAREMRGTTHRFFLQGAVGVGSTIAWRLPPPVGSQARVSSQSVRGVCRVSASEMVSTYEVQVSSTATDSPTRQIVFDVSPAGASVTSVEGDGVASWLHVDGALSVTLSTESRAASLRIEMRIPVVLPDSDLLPVALPSLILLGAKQVPAIAEVVLEEGVELLELQASRPLNANIAEWDAVAGPATALIRKVTPRIGVDVDARVFVSRDFVEIDRTLNAASDVAVDHLKVDLPSDEELLEVTWISGPKLEWKRVGQSVEIDWLSSLQGQSQAKWSVKSRKKLDSAAAQQSVAVSNIAIAEARKVAGYVALDHEPGWSIALKETGGLEDRDVRLTPVKGRMAWFSLRDFSLGFDVQRKDSIVDAEITAYALPRARTIEIEGQIALDISGAPLRQIEVRVSPAQSKLMRFTSPLIAEQVLDEATGSWKLTLARESTGRVPLRFRLSLPGRADGDESIAAKTLVATLPRLELPMARRFRGSWVVEANTDTQLSFSTQSLQPVDVMRVPAVQDYTPRHRLVAAFAYGSGAHELTVTAARHASSPLAALVVSQLRLTSVLSQDGTSKHEALLNLSHSGEQFAHVKLPAGAQLLSAIVNGSAVKPVRGENGTIALPLPGGSANTDTVSARVLYELSGEPWRSTGKRKLEPITLLGDAPILSTHWTVQAPEGFSYDEVDTGLEQRGTFEPEGLGLALGQAVGLVYVSTLGSQSVDLVPGGGFAHQQQWKKRSTVDSTTAISPLPEAPPDLLDSSRHRKSMRAAVDEQWENRVPTASAALRGDEISATSSMLDTKMDRMVFPNVSFSNATLEEAVEFLRHKSRDLDTNEPDPTQRGVPLVIQSSDFNSKTSITLDLKNVPMSVALRYVTELAGMSYRVEPQGVVIRPLTVTATELSKSGIIPLELEIPTAGQVLTFEGTQAPEVLDLGYTSWERQMARACLLMALGGLLFAFWGRHRAFLRTVLVVLLLSLGVKLVAEAQVPLANAILFGWLVAWVIWMMFRLFTRLDAPRSPRAVAAAALALGSMVLQSNSLGQELKLPPDPAAHTVIVPYDVKKPISGQKPQRYYLDRDSFEKLWSLAKENRRPEVPAGSDAKDAATIHSAAYRASVEEGRLLIEARLEIGTRGAWTLTALPFKSDDSTIAVVRDWMIDGKPAAVVNGNIQIEKPGVHQVQAMIELNRKSGWKEAAMRLPAAGAAFVEITTPMTDGRPELEGVDLLTEKQQGDRRLFTAVLTKPSVWKLKRSPRRPLADAAVPAVAESELIIGHSSSGAQSLLGTVQFGFPGTERKNFSLTVDADWQIAGWTVRQQSGEVAVRHWSAREEAGRRVLNFELDRPVADEAAVSLWGTRSAGTGAFNSPVLEPTVLKGQQLVVLLHDETLKLEPKPVADQRRVDKPTGVSPVLAGGRGKTTELFYRLPLKQTLAYELKAAASGLECVTDYVFQLSEQKQEMMAAVTLKRSRDAWAQLRLGLPAGFEIQSVDGPGLSSWKQEKDDLFLQFQPNGSTTETRLILYLARSVPESLSTWKLQTLRFPDFEKQSGSAVIVAHAATEARLSDFAGSPDVREVDPADVAGVFVITPPLEKKRALRFERGDWTANVALAKQAVRFSSDGIVLAQATDAGLLVSQQVAFFVEQGALGRVTVRLPASLPEATVKGEALREVQTRINGTVREYDCSFQSDVLSHAALTFDMELPLVESLTLPMVKVDGAERLRRFFVLDNSSSREARVVKVDGVESCAKGALPYVPDVLSQPTFYRSKGDNGDLQIAYQQLQSTEGNAAIVTLADITSAWRSDGERWDTVVYSVYNRSLQFLPVILPANAELVGVSVSGEAVRADEETRPDGSLVRLIPLIQTRAGQRSLEVRLIYRMKATEGGRLTSLKSLRMDDPELLGISAERTLWTAIVPKRLTIGEIDGNMEEVAEESKVVERLQGLMSDFSRMNKALSSRGNVSKAEGDYTLMEAEKLAQQIEVESSKVEQLSRSKSSYSRSKPKADDDGKELKMQEKVLNDITDLNESIVKQKVVLTENRAQAPVYNAKDSSLSISNTWSANNAPTGGDRAEFDGFINYGKPIAVPATDVMGNSQSIVLNDNTLVQNDFLKSPQAVRQSGTIGSIAGAAGVTVLKSGAGILDLSGTNTYTGATTVAAGSLIVGTGGVSMVNGGAQFSFGATSANLPGHGNAMPKEQAAQVFNSGNNGRANVVSQIQPQRGQAIQDGMPDAEKMMGGRSVPLPAVQSPSPSTRTADAVMSPADPFSAAPAAPAAAPSAGDGAKKADQVDKIGDAFDAPEIPQSFGLEAQVSSQLRATGRRSLLVEVPSDGQAYHFRKLKDHAVLELHLQKAWTAEQKSTAIWLGVGLAVWGLVTRVTNRRRKTIESVQ